MPCGRRRPRAPTYPQHSPAAAALTGRSLRAPCQVEIDNEDSTMGTTLPKIHNLRTLSGDISAPALLERGIVRVDRKTPWGNQYPIGKRFGSRADVIERYRQDLWRRIRSGEMPLEEPRLARLPASPRTASMLPLRLDNGRRRTNRSTRKPRRSPKDYRARWAVCIPGEDTGKIPPRQHWGRIATERPSRNRPL